MTQQSQLDEGWKCCGCGAPSPDRKRVCGCVTSCLYRGRDHALKIEDVAFPYPRGIGRIADNDRALIVYFDVVPTDDEMRMIHDSLRAAHAENA